MFYQANSMQNLISAAAHLATEMLVNADQQVTSLIKTIEEFKNPEVEMRDPQKEAAKVLQYIKGEQEWDLL